MKPAAYFPQKLVDLTRTIDEWPLWPFLFPRQESHPEKYSLAKRIGIFVVVSLLASLSGFFLRPGGMIGFDWLHFWSIDFIPAFYPPWTSWILQFLTWNLLLGISIGGFTVLVITRYKHLSSAVLSYFCLPFFWILLLGQIDGVATAGLVALPLSIPLALIKPQITIFAMFSKRSLLIITLLFLIFSILIFGFWPSAMLNVETTQSVQRAEQNIGLGGWWTLLAVAGLWLSRGDMDMLMLAGTAALPYLIPYHLFPIVPAVARLKPWAALIAVVISWLPLSSNWIGPGGWWFGWLFVARVWGNLAVQRYAGSPIFHRIKPIFTRQISWIKRAI